jgi:hypothetical protein
MFSLSLMPFVGAVEILLAFSGFPESSYSLCSYMVITHTMKQMLFLAFTGVL